MRSGTTTTRSGTTRTAATAANTALALAPTLDGSDLDLYYREVARFRVLTPAEELETARRWYDEQDVEAAHTLVTANLRFVIKIANEYRRYGFRLLDLVQEGNVGLMRAVHKFNPYKGYRLITYAVWWIRAHIHDFILRSWSLVRIGTTRAQRRMFNHLQSAQKRIKALLGYEAAALAAPAGDGAPELTRQLTEDQLLATELEIPVDEVTEFRRRVQVPDLSLEENVHEDGDLQLKDRLVDPGLDQEEALGEAQARERLAARLREAVQALDERDQLIVRERLLTEEPVTLQDLGERLGVSKERVRQLEARVKERLRVALADCRVAFA
jgi:RNA polymerase sigma-32 factor